MCTVIDDYIVLTFVWCIKCGDICLKKDMAYYYHLTSDRHIIIKYYVKMRRREKRGWFQLGTHHILKYALCKLHGYSELFLSVNCFTHSGIRSEEKWVRILREIFFRQFNSEKGGKAFYQDAPGFSKVPVSVVFLTCVDVELHIIIFCIAVKLKRKELKRVRDMQCMFRADMCGTMAGNFQVYVKMMWMVKCDVPSHQYPFMSN